MMVGFEFGFVKSNLKTNFFFGVSPPSISISFLGGGCSAQSLSSIDMMPLRSCCSDWLDLESGLGDGESDTDLLW